MSINYVLCCLWPFTIVLLLWIPMAVVARFKGELNNEHLAVAVAWSLILLIVALLILFYPSFPKSSELLQWARIFPGGVAIAVALTIIALFVVFLQKIKCSLGSHRWDWKPVPIRDNSCKQERLCAICGKKEVHMSESHVWTEWQSLPDSCNQSRMCIRCHLEQHKDTHVWGEWEDIPNSHEQKRVCSRCGKLENRTCMVSNSAESSAESTFESGPRFEWGPQLEDEPDWRWKVWDKGVFD